MCRSTAQNLTLHHAHTKQWTCQAAVHFHQCWLLYTSTNVDVARKSLKMERGVAYFCTVSVVQTLLLSAGHLVPFDTA